MYFGVKFEDDRVIYVDDLSTDLEAKISKLKDLYLCLDEKYTVETIFNNYTARLNETPQYYYLCQGETTVWVVAAKERPLGFEGPAETFQDAYCYANVVRVGRQIYSQNKAVYEEKQAMFEKYFHKPFDKIQLKDLEAAGCSRGSVD